MGDGLRGTCHCGAVALDLELSEAPGRLKLRACQCDFCRCRGARTISDPGGHAVIRMARADAVNRYRFGLRSADYLVCASCGTYVAAIQPDEERPIAVVNVGGMNVAAFAKVQPTFVSYGDETLEARRARRAEYWMPITVDVVGKTGGRSAGVGVA